MFFKFNKTNLDKFVFAKCFKMFFFKPEKYYFFFYAIADLKTEKNEKVYFLTVKPVFFKGFPL